MGRHCHLKLPHIVLISQGNVTFKLIRDFTLNYKTIDSSINGALPTKIPMMHSDVQALLHILAIRNLAK